MKYFIKTFGCQANEADSERIAAFYEGKGWKPARLISEADEIIINTCSVRESAENRVFGLVNNLVKSRKKKQKLILTGCLVGSVKSERPRLSLRELKSKLPNIDELKTLSELIGKKMILPKQKNLIHASIPIMEGCDNFCSYCVVPYSRGRETSRPFNEIICEIEELIKRGCQEITFLGQNVNSYGKEFTLSEIQAIQERYKIFDIKNPFALLLWVTNSIDGIKKIKFLTSNPWELTKEIIEVMKLSKIDRYLHLPVQSGDDVVLSRMNRKYTANEYLTLVKKIRRAIPDIEIGTDIIVGFPGESEEQFQHTVDLCLKVGFVKAYISLYSPRPGTAAFKLKDDIPHKEKRRRWKVLEDLINQKYQ